MESLFSYTDYRLFLKDYYDQQKLEKKQFSYQFWADHCGFKSKSYLYKVIRGEKLLSVDGALKIGSYLKLKKKQMNYFQAIVLFTNAKTIAEKDFYFAKLQEYSKNEEACILRKNQYRYFNRWYNSAIREVILMVDWNNDYSVLAGSVIPAITPKEAKQSVELLLELGIIEINSEGKYRRCNKAISTGPDVVSLAVNHFQKENLVLASKAIDRFARPIRDISTLTMSISESGSERILKEIADFRKKLIGIVSEEKDVDRVYQINFQAFPLSLPKKDK